MLFLITQQYFQVPGLNSWAEPSEALANQHKAWTSQQREKRARDDDNGAVDPMDLVWSSTFQDVFSCSLVHGALFDITEVVYLPGLKS